MAITTTEPTITEHEAAQVERANASNATPIVFVHGLWLLPSSWDRWVTLFEEAGYVALTPGWPDDPETVEEAREHPEVFAGKGIGAIADYEEAIIRPSRCHPDVASLFEQRHPAVPARRQQPEPVNEDNGCGIRGVRALDLRCLVLRDGRLGGCDGHLLLLVFVTTGRYGSRRQRRVR